MAQRWWPWGRTGACLLWGREPPCSWAPVEGSLGDLGVHQRGCGHAPAGPARLRKEEDAAVSVPCCLPSGCPCPQGLSHCHLAETPVYVARRASKAGTNLDWRCWLSLSP